MKRRNRRNTSLLRYGDGLGDRKWNDILRKEKEIRDRKKDPCTNCGQRGSHFVPPSLGEPGRFICTRVEIPY